MFDFTVNTYSKLLETLIEQDYQFQTFEEFLTNPDPRTIVLRHNVDNRPKKSLELANIESWFGLKGVYNFRVLSCSWDEDIIKEIASLGHEIGYHYEDLAICKGDQKRAFNSFKENLQKLRDLVPVSTITMHGSPTSRHDSRDLWKIYSWHNNNWLWAQELVMQYSKNVAKRVLRGLRSRNSICTRNNYCWRKT